MKRSPMPKRRTTKRRTLSPRCERQRCNRIARIEGWCVPHAEQEADRLFSLWVRERDGGCTAAGMFGIQCSGPLQAAHIVGRRNHSVRFDTANVHTACAAHHMHIDQYGSEAAKYRWALTCLARYGISYAHLMEAANVVTARTTSIEHALAKLAPFAENGAA